MSRASASAEWRNGFYSQTNKLVGENVERTSWHRTFSRDFIWQPKWQMGEAMVCGIGRALVAWQLECSQIHLVGRALWYFRDSDVFLERNFGTEDTQLVTAGFNILGSE